LLLHEVAAAQKNKAVADNLDMCANVDDQLHDGVMLATKARILI